MPANFVELNVRQIAAKFVPRLLSNDQKQHQLERKSAFSGIVPTEGPEHLSSSTDVQPFLNC
jgi:hypothetical protein